MTRTLEASPVAEEGGDCPVVEAAAATEAEADDRDAADEDGKSAEGIDVPRHHEVLLFWRLLRACLDGDDCRVAGSCV